MYNCNIVSYNLITKYNNHIKLNPKFVKEIINIDFEKIYQNNNIF